MALLALLAIPLISNESCGEALEKADQTPGKTTSTGDTSTDEITPMGDKVLPVLPGGEEGEDLLKSGGPKIKSAPLPEEE